MVYLALQKIAFQNAECGGDFFLSLCQYASTKGFGLLEALVG